MFLIHLRGIFGFFLRRFLKRYGFKDRSDVLSFFSVPVVLEDVTALSTGFPDSCKGDLGKNQS